MFCMLRLPYLWLLTPWYLLAVILYALHIVKKNGFLRMLEIFIVFVPNKQKFIKRFWDKNFKHIQQWYLDVRQDSDIIISASPAYDVGEICGRLGVNYICSPSSPKTFLVEGSHCYGAQKVVEYRKRFGDTPLETYYSDSMSDVPMFQIAKRGYLVKGDKITLVYENGQPVL